MKRHHLESGVFSSKIQPVIEALILLPSVLITDEAEPTKCFGSVRHLSV